MLAVSRAADEAIRREVQSAWKPDATYADKTEAIAELDAPMEKDVVAVLRRSMLEAYKAAAAYARAKVKKEKAKRNKRPKVRGKRGVIQEYRIIRARIQELDVDEVAYEQISKEYRAWVDKLGQEMWQDKVRAARDAMTGALEGGYSLNPVTHYEDDDGNRVSAFEATGGAGGRENVLEGYKFVEDQPGLMNKLDEALSAWGYSGYQTERVARTEYARAMNDGLLSIYGEDAAIVALEWNSLRDMGVCQECAMLHGTVFDKGDPRVAIYQPPIHVNCVIGETPVVAPDQVAGFVSAYEGPVVELTLSDSRRLTVTPNHMLMTPQGFIRAMFLRKGDKVLDGATSERITVGCPDKHGQPSLIKDVVEAFAERRSVHPARVPVASEDFHGDGVFLNGDIHVIMTNRLLRDRCKVSNLQCPYKQPFIGTDAADLKALASKGDLASVLVAMALAADGGVGRRRQSRAFSGRHASHPDLVRFGTISSLNTTDEKPSFDGATINVIEACKRKLGIALMIPTADVVNVQVRQFSGHVYDLQTLSTLYLANGIVSSNCRCELLPVFAWDYQGANVDVEREQTLYDKNEKPFTVKYVPGRINPEFLSPIRAANNEAGIKQQLLTRDAAEALRKGFEPKKEGQPAPAVPPPIQPAVPRPAPAVVPAVARAVTPAAGAAPVLQAGSLPGAAEAAAAYTGIAPAPGAVGLYSTTPTAVIERKIVKFPKEGAQEKNIGGGHVNAVLKLEAPDGTIVAFKPGKEFEPMGWSGIRDGTQYIREAAAYELDKVMGAGIVPPVTKGEYKPTDQTLEDVRRSSSRWHHGVHWDNPKVGMLQTWIPNMKDLNEAHRLGVTPTVESDRNLLVFDLIIGNTDRHGGNVNVMIDGPDKGKIIAVDQGLSFLKANPRTGLHPDYSYGTYDYDAHKGTPLSVEQKGWLDKLFARKDEVTNTLKNTGLDDAEIAAMFSRAQVMKDTGKIVTIQDASAHGQSLGRI